MSEATTNPLGTERIGRLMVRYAVPSIISLVINSLYNMVDQIFIGQAVGYLGNAATNVILPVTTFLMAVGFMLGDGAAAYMSLNLGKNKTEAAAQGVGNMITLSLGTGLVLTMIFIVFLKPFCYLFGATEMVIPYALEYGRIIVLGFPAAIVAIAFGGVIRADGRPKMSMAGLVIGCVTNVILDPIFIFGFGWGVRGAAVATVFGQILNALFYIICLYSFRTIRLKKHDLKLKKKVGSKIMLLGISSFITQTVSVIIIVVMNNLLVEYGRLSKYGGDIPLAVIGIVTKISQLITGITLGIVGGIQPILGYNYGSCQYHRVKKTYKMALCISTLIMVAALLVFQVFPKEIIGIFGQESDLYVEFAIKCFRIYLLACFMVPASSQTGNFFQAIGKPVHATVLSLSRQVICLIPVMLILCYFIGLDGILWAGPISDTASGVISLVTVKVYWNRIFERK